MKVVLDKGAETHLERFIKFLKSGWLLVDRANLEAALTSSSTEIIQSYTSWLEAGEPMAANKEVHSGEGTQE